MNRVRLSVVPEISWAACTRGAGASSSISTGTISTPFSSSSARRMDSSSSSISFAKAKASSVASSTAPSSSTSSTNERGSSSARLISGTPSLGGDWGARRGPRQRPRTGKNDRRRPRIPRIAEEFTGEVAWTSCESDENLQENLPGLLVSQDFPLDPLERVVDRLGVAPELLRHLFVRATLEIEPKRISLEPGEAGPEREDEALELLGGDDADGRIVHAGAREGVAQAAFAVRLLAGGGMAEGDVRVERGVLEAGRRLDRRDDLARHAELGEAPKGSLFVRPEVANGLVEADQPLLNEVLGIAAGEEIRARLQPDEARVAPHQNVEGVPVPVPRPENQLKVLELSLRFLRGGCGPYSHANSPGCQGREGNSHPKVEGDDSKDRWSLQAACNGPRMLRTYVR